MNREILIKKIRNVLDLNLYEARVYLAILAYGPLERRQVYKKSGIPQSRAYDTAIALKNKGLINNLIKEKEEYYQVLTPKHSINAYLTQLKWAHEEELEKEKIKFENKIELIRKKFSENITQKQKESKKLSPILKEIYSKPIPDDEELIQLIRGEVSLVNHIAEQVRSSKKVIRNINLPPYLPEALVWENIFNKLKEGLKYFHLANNNLLFEWGLWRIEEDKRSGVFFKFLPEEQINEKFYIFDDDSCLIRLRDPITNNFSESGVLFKDPTWIMEHQKKFDVSWKKAVSFEELKNKIMNKKEGASRWLNNDEKILLDRILERGRYATTSGLKIKGTDTILKSLERKKLIIPHEKSISGYVANPKFFLG